MIHVISAIVIIVGIETAWYVAIPLGLLCEAWFWLSVFSERRTEKEKLEEAQRDTHSLWDKLNG